MRITLVLMCLLLWLLSCKSAAKYYKLSDHFDGKVFHNDPPSEKRGLCDFLRWRFSLNKIKENKKNLVHNFAIPKPLVTGEHTEITFVGHATFLIQGQGINILTDPIWSKRCSPVFFAGPKRITEPGIKFDDLPRIDVVIISHNHYDHMDIATLKKLYKRDKPFFIVPLRNQHILNKYGIEQVIEQDWWDSKRINNKVLIHSVPAKHWSGRGLFDRNDSLWSGFVISLSGSNIFFAGDTGFGPHFDKIKSKFNSFDIALIPIGAYLPRWFMKPHHLSPNDAIKVANILEAKINIPMHYGTFALGDDGFDFSLTELVKKVKQTNKNNFTLLKIGQTFIL